MKIRADIAELLHTGLSNRAIGNRLGVDPHAVGAARRAMKLPNVRPGTAPRDKASHFHARTIAVDGGHLEWTGSRDQHGLPILRTGGNSFSPFRVAFRLRHGREPVGKVLPGCEHRGCVAPDHVEDRPMRERYRQTYAAIFGTPA
ncbi:hypothetical protein [Streptomyces sp. NPDC002994]|uniref:hypothetical protein n=1 Tax=Streptomyces sp. NPDC002994 TaxID=3154441 RepID=UPI0033AFEDA9